MTESMEIPPELFARLAHPTVRLSGSIDEATAASFLSQVLPVLEVPSSCSNKSSAQARARGFLSFLLSEACGRLNFRSEFDPSLYRF